MTTAQTTTSSTAPGTATTRRTARGTGPDAVPGLEVALARLRALVAAEEALHARARARPRHAPELMGRDDRIHALLDRAHDRLHRVVVRLCGPPARAADGTRTVGDRWSGPMVAAVAADGTILVSYADSPRAEVADRELLIVEPRNVARLDGEGGPMSDTTYLGVARRRRGWGEFLACGNAPGCEERCAGDGMTLDRVVDLELESIRRARADWIEDGCDPARHHEANS